ncbi:MAG: methionine--tRNA ligase [Chloroflexi bacterium]|nr:methionine--tRNA ligase [Chloroflexota bacterium]
MSTETIHVSVAWPYANGDLHIGHLAGCYLPADIFARYHRLRGNRVLMVSGSDSHGTPITVEADKRGTTARAIFEHYHERFLQTQRKIGVSYDLFTHTDTENHHRVAQDIFTTLLERGYLYKERQTLLYSESEKRFLPDRYVEGTCYICKFPQARGDQCDNCGNLIDAVQLIEPHSRNNPADKLVKRESEHYFLDLGKFAEQILDYLNEHEAHWRPNVSRFSQNFVKDGLRGRPITRDIDWGVRVPLPGWEDKRLYVWFDAVMGYFTASIEWARNTGQPDAWKQWWYNPQAKIYNFIGKDNIPFHTIIWQAELLGIDGIYNDGVDTPLQLPYDVPANEFMNIEGQQFSTSRNWAVWLPDLLERYQADAVRFYVARTFPERQDSDFSWDGFLARVNNELLAAWGNLVNRMLGFAFKRFDGVVPAADNLTAEDEAIIARCEAGLETVGGLIADVRLKEALEETLGLARAVNGWLNEREPWKVIKQDRADAARSVYTALRCIDNLKILFAPFTPFSSQQAHEMLGYDGQLFGEQRIENYSEETRDHLALIYDGAAAIGRWEASKLESGQKLRKPSPLFTKLDAEIVEQERQYLGQPRVEGEIG